MSCDSEFKFQMIKFNENKKKCNCSDILIVDDNQFNAHIFNLKLSQYGFKVEIALSGNSAI